MDAVNCALPGSAAGGPQSDPIVTVQHPPIEVIADDDDDDNPRGGVSPPPHFNPPPPLPQFFMPESVGGSIGVVGGGFPASLFSSGAMVAGPSGSGRAGPSAAGVSMAADFLPMGPAVRSRLLELHIEYRDRMIHLKVPVPMPNMQK